LTATTALMKSCRATLKLKEGLAGFLAAVPWNCSQRWQTA
jgi:hypothetical protein